MPNYANGKIYKLMSLTDDYIYIGSTTLSLAMRKAKHRSESEGHTKNHRAVNVHFNSIGWNNCHIVLIEAYACTNKDELVKKEFEHIQANNNDKLLNVMKYEQKCEYSDDVCNHCGSIHRTKIECFDCNGLQMCKHNKIRKFCNQCNIKHYCHECEKGFYDKADLAKHEKSKWHKKTYDRMFAECFGD